MRHSSLIWFRVENLVASSEKGIQDSNWSRLGISLDDPENAPCPESRFFLSPTNYSISGRNE
jgi:hypothetical protein